MIDVVESAFRKTVERIRSEVRLMPLSRWNESVVRYWFCEALATAHPDVEQFVECDKIDLVLSRSPQRAFIEFKFYRHPRRFDPYDGNPRGFKGGPGRQNLREFQSCIDMLHRRRSQSGLSKYLVLIYADPTDGSRPSLRFARQYEEYHHPDEAVALRLVESSEQILTSDVVRAQLYEVGAA
jgi:hypothetical protein